MLKARHPLSDATYEYHEDGTVHVASGDASGIFKRNGEWVSGTLKWADPHYCQWLVQKGQTLTPLRNPLVGR
jgi:hypothetical protein